MVTQLRMNDFACSHVLVYMCVRSISFPGYHSLHYASQQYSVLKTESFVLDSELCALGLLLSFLMQTVKRCIVPSTPRLSTQFQQVKTYCTMHPVRLLSFPALLSIVVVRVPSGDAFLSFLSPGCIIYSTCSGGPSDFTLVLKSGQFAFVTIISMSMPQVTRMHPKASPGAVPSGNLVIGAPWRTSYRFAISS